MAKGSKGGNRGQHNIRSSISRRVIKTTNGTDSKSSSTVTMVVMPGQQVNLLDTLKERFPLAIEAIIGKYINFQNMKFDDMLARIEQFFKTMNITFELPKGNKNVSVIRELLTGPLQRAETDLGNLVW
jgi:hypothetical protein